MTLIELMVALAIGVILLTIGIPAFQTMMQGNQATGSANEMLGAIRLARSEAVKRAAPVTLCPKNADNSGCVAGAWQNGWLLFTDADWRRTGRLSGKPRETWEIAWRSGLKRPFVTGRVPLTGRS